MRYSIKTTHYSLFSEGMLVWNHPTYLPISHLLYEQNFQGHTSQCDNHCIYLYPNLIPLEEFDYSRATWDSPHQYPYLFFIYFINFMS